MEILAILLILGALWLGHKIGNESGRSALLDVQSRSIAEALESNNEFYRKLGIHGNYLLDGHEYRTPTDFVIVKFSDLERALKHRDSICVDGDSEPDDDSSPSDHQDKDESIEPDDAYHGRKFFPSTLLAQIVGKAPLSKTEAAKRVWKYIQDNELQDAHSPNNFKFDEKLIAIIGEETCTPFRLIKLIGDHLS